MKRSIVATLLALGLVALARPAAAEPSAWLSGGGGVGLLAHGSSLGADGVALPNGVSGSDTRPVMSFTLGVGTTPAARFAVGGVLRLTTTFDLGTDVSIGPRFATGGFARGDFGLAFDLGVAFRTYKDGIYGRVPLQAVALFGVPFGLQFGLGVQALSLDGGTQAAGGFALLEIDVLRLTVLRQGSSTNLWENPSPLGGRVREISKAPAVGPLREHLSSH